jgi:hypothetical protein
MREHQQSATRAIIGTAAPGILIAVLMSLLMCISTGQINAGSWQTWASVLCLAGALAASAGFFLELRTDGATVFFLMLPLVFLAAVISLCLVPDMVLTWMA